MKTGQEHLNSFTPEVQGRIIRNFKEGRSYELFSLTWPMHMERKFESSKRFLSMSFVWSQTAEGLEYWGNLAGTES